jgi:hypothetical protein
MFGKHFASMYEGSMYGAGLNVFAVWGYVIANARHSRIELNAKRLADTLGGTEEAVQGAIDALASPDPQSRHKEHEGRRLVKEGEFQYYVPSWEEYRRIKSEDDRRAYNAAKQREYRLRKPPKPGKPLAGEKRFLEAEANGDRAAADRIAAEGLPQTEYQKLKEQHEQALERKDYPEAVRLHALVRAAAYKEIKDGSVEGVDR